MNNRRSNIEIIADILRLSEAGKTEIMYEEDSKEQSYVTKEELEGFEQGIKGLLRSFLEFFVSYGLELGKPAKGKFEELNQKLQGLGG